MSRYNQLYRDKRATFPLRCVTIQSVLLRQEEGLVVGYVVIQHCDTAGHGPLYGREVRDMAEEKVTRLAAAHAGASEHDA